MPDNIIEATSAKENLAATPGSDLFVFEPGDSSPGSAKDQIFGFQPGDRIDLTAFGFTGFRTISDPPDPMMLTVRQLNDSVVIWGGRGESAFELRIIGVTAEQILAAVLLDRDDDDGDDGSGDANADPVAVDDVFETVEDAPVMGDVLANDSDADGDALTSMLIDGPANGSVSLNADGDFEYTPNPGFAGTDAFTYRVDDQNGGSDVATVTVTVAADDSDDPVDPVDANVIDATPERENHQATDAPDIFRFEPGDSGPRMLSDQIFGFGAGDLIDLTAFGFTGVRTISDPPDPTKLTIRELNDSVVMWGGRGPAAFQLRVLDVTAGEIVDAIILDGSIDDGGGDDDDGSTGDDNTAPVAVDDVAFTDEDTTVMGDVLANDTDADGDALTATVVSGPSNGSLTLNADGAYEYAPDADFTGTDGFTYTVTDAAGAADTGVVTITVGADNDAPVAVDDAATTDEDVAVMGDVLVNDADADGDDLTAALLSGPSNGSVTLASDGSYAYTPDADFNGTDDFTYTVADSSGATETGVVTITVEPVNDAPVAVDDSATTQANVATSGDVLANDTDIDGDDLTVSLVDDVENGVLTLNADGTFDYAPNVDFDGIDAFAYSVSDGDGGTDTAVVTLTVDPVDAPTTIGGDLQGAATEDDATPAAGVVSVAGSAGAMITPQSDVAGAYGTFSINADGEWSYVLDSTNADVQSLRALETLTERSQFGDVVIETETSATNPHVSQNGAGGGGDNLNARGGDFEGVVMTIDYADGTSETVVWDRVDAVTGEAVGSGVTATASGSTHFGGFDLSATNRVAKITLETLPAAKVFFDVTRAFNGQPGDTAGTFGGGPLIVVGGDPLSGLITTQYSGIIGFEGQPFGADAFTTVEIDFSGLDDGGFLGSTEFGIDLDRLAVEGDLAPVDAIGPVVTSPPTDVLYDEFTVTTDDGVSETIRIAIDGANDAASFLSSSVTTGAVEEDGVLQATGRVRVSDDDSLESSTQVQIGVAGVFGAFSVDEAGRWSYDLDNDSAAVQALGAGETATDSFTVVSADGAATETVVITVTGTVDAGSNADPVAPDVSASGSEDTVISGVVAATDADGDTLGYALGGTAPTNGEVSIDAATGAFDYTPDADFNGTDSFTVLVDDGEGGSTEATVDVTVDPANDDPTAADIAVFGDENTVISGALSATDIDGDDLTYGPGATAPTNGAVEVQSDGSFDYTPNPNFSGTDSFTIAVEDGQGGSAEVSVMVTIGDVNQAPTAPDVSVVGSEDTVISGVVAATDVDGDMLSYSAGGTSPTNGAVSIDPASGAFDYTPDPDFAGTDSFTVLIEDGEGGSTEATVTVTVNPDADAATIGGDLTGTAVEDAAAPTTGVATVVDADAGEAVFQAQSNVAGDFGTFSIDADGDWTYTLDNSNATVQSLRAADTLSERSQFRDIIVETEALAINPHVTTNGSGDASNPADLDNRNARGSDFDGSVVTAEFADGSTETVTWRALDASSGEARGTNILIEATGSTHFGGFMISTTETLTKLTMETLPGGKVFFDIGRAFEGGAGNTENTGGGNPVIVVDADASVSGTIAATYSGIIGLEGDGFSSDAYTTVEIDFSGLSSGGVDGAIDSRRRPRSVAGRRRHSPGRRRASPGHRPADGCALRFVHDIDRGWNDRHDRRRDLRRERYGDAVRRCRRLGRGRRNAAGDGAVADFRHGCARELHAAPIVDRRRLRSVLDRRDRALAL